MRVSFKLLPALALLCYGSGMAQQLPQGKATLSITDPRIPGIRIVRAADAEFARLKLADSAGIDFALLNESPRAIIGVGVTYHFGTGLRDANDYFIDGISVPMHVGRGETIIAGAGLLKASNSTDEVRPGIQGTATAAEIAFLVFEDGTYYGSDRWAGELMDKSQARRNFFSELAKANDKVAFIEAAEACLNDEKCRNVSGLSREEMFHRAGTIDEFRALSSFGADRQFFQASKANAERFPVIRKVNRLAREDLSVEPRDGGTWYTYNVYANCANGSSAYSASLTNGCTFPFNSTGSNPPSGSTQLASPSGFWARYGAECALSSGGQIQTTDYIHDEMVTLKIQAGSDPLQAQYVPRENVYTKITSDYGPGGGATRWTLGRLSGVIEPFNILTANVDGGTTACYGAWQSGTSPFHITQADQLLSTGPGGTGTLYSQNVSGATTFYPQGSGPFYGYVTTDKLVNKFCNPAFATNVSTYPSVSSAYQGVLESREYTWCEHFPPQRVQNQCDIGTDYCCCVAAGFNLLFCAESTGCIDPSDGGLGYCGSGGCGPYGGGTEAVAFAYEAQRGLTPPPVGINTHPSDKPFSKIGVFRYNTWILDTPGMGAWVGAPPDTLSYFAPPGGVQAGDIPVVGDWNGTGQTKAGFVRNEGGLMVWYLDANGNGVWDDPAQGGGDYRYTYGTFSAAGVRPIVGDWQGSGKDCIGYFYPNVNAQVSPPINTITFVINATCGGVFAPFPPFVQTFNFGLPGDTPIVGKWNGTQAQVGVVRNVNGSLEWILDWAAANDYSQADHFPGQGLACGRSDWQSNAQCLTPAPFFFGLAGDIPIVGNWLGAVSPYTNQPVSFAGVFRQGSPYTQFIQDTDGTQQHLAVYYFGFNGDIPLIGNW